MKVQCDLHVHTCLSPCGDLGSSPTAVVQEAVKKGISVLGICDHNSALNCRTAILAGNASGVLVIPGIEVATRDEAHIITLFPSVEPALELGAELYRLLPPVPDVQRGADTELDQVFVDTEDVILGEVDKFLAAGADIGIEDVIDFVHGAGGMVIPAHIDKPVFSIISQLGFIPDLPFDALEIFSETGITIDSELPRITSSDAHYIGDIGRKGISMTGMPSGFEEVKTAIIRGLFTRFYP